MDGVLYGVLAAMAAQTPSTQTAAMRAEA